MYDPSLGRWLTPDPIGFHGGDVNLYGYVGNNPVNRLDPSGLSEISVDVSRVEPIKPYKDKDKGIDEPGTELGGLGFRVTAPRGSKISLIQFVKVHAYVTCTYFNTCRQVSSYIDHTHQHGKVSIRTSNPKQPIWNIDNLGELSPVYPRVEDASPPNGNVTILAMTDWPIITNEITREIEQSQQVKNMIAAMQRARPNEGKVTCSVIVKAEFITYVVVDGKVVNSVQWSTGDGFYPRVNASNLP